MTVPFQFDVSAGRTLTLDELNIAQGNDGRMTFHFLVAYCGGYNEVFDALLDDTLPEAWREEANGLIDRQEVIARAHYRLARQLERQS